MHYGIDRRFGDDPWKIVEDRFDMEKNAQSQSIFSLANEYMGTRGLFEEGGTHLGEKGYEGCYINGIYVREEYQYIWKRQGMPQKANFIANTTNWLPVYIQVGDEVFSMGKSDFSKYRRVLDMQKGILSREVEFVCSTGEKTALSFERFISYDCKHCAAVRVRIKPLNHSKVIKVKLALEGHTGNEMFVKHEKAGEVMFSESGEEYLTLLKKLPSTGQFFITRCYVDCPLADARQTINDDVFAPALVLTFHPRMEQCYTIDKLVATVSSRDCGYTYGLIDKEAENRDVDPSVEKEIIEFLLKKSSEIIDDMRCLSYDALLAKHIAAVGNMWARSDVEIQGDPWAQQGIRYCMFQLNNTYRGFDSRLNIAAKGLTGEVYQGRHFWDTESYCLPYYLFTNTQAAKNLVESRYHDLDAARKLARIFRYPGAMYPWQTIDGTEDCPIWEYTFGEIHINAIIPYAIYLYVRITGDKDYLYEKGIEVVLETSRFWAGRCDYIPYRNGYAINRVTGPDEYQQMTNNNYYTNYMARFTLKYAIEIIDEMKTENPEALKVVMEKIDFSKSEMVLWQNIIDNIILDTDDSLGIFVEDDMFLSLTPKYREDLSKEFDIPLESKWSIEKFQKAQLVKQPDVLLLFFLFPECFTLEQKKSNYRFYEQRTVHGSSLSPCIHSIIANEIGRYRQAYEYYLWSSRLDLDDFNGNVFEGLHISAMSGTWLNIIFGFGGMRILEDGLSFRPTLPREWSEYCFKLNYRGSVIQIAVSRGGVTGKILDGKPLKVILYGRKIELSKKETWTAMPTEIVEPTTLKGVIFDLDGVITRTDSYHFKAWKKMADHENIYFDEKINRRLKGVSRSASLEIILEKADREYSPEEKEKLSTMKNSFYVKMLDDITPDAVLPGIKELFKELREAKIKVALYSASRNTYKILERLGIETLFDVVVTGADVKNSKPHPEGMLLAAARLGLPPQNCAVIEDSFAGIQAANEAGMKSIGIGDKIELHNSDYTLKSTKFLNLEKIRMVF